MAIFYLFSRSYMPKKSYLCGANIKSCEDVLLLIKKTFLCMLDLHRPCTQTSESNNKQTT